MKLSVIIVNYNVKYFLEQALFSVYKALKNIEAEVFVVDNNSVDGSVEMLRERFPEVTLIANQKNSGFSVANNQAMKLAQGEYILLLNPDTIVEEDTFEKVIQFMDTHPDAGGLGVKMIDGSGKFLPESKRGLPVPSVAFYKVFGLSALFPKSKIFGRYHLGFLDKDKTHTVDILSGAFMLMRKTVIDKVGMLDESFFMYGEDIDLSYRILLGGYKNYYFPETRIIHYKGESTKKSSINYVFMFYNAMIIFAKKHFSQKNARLFSFLIHIAIFIRAGMAIGSRFVKKAFLPVTDSFVLYVGMDLLKSYWETNVKVSEGLRYPVEFMQIVVPCYIFIWLTSVFFNGGYDTPIKISKIIRGIITGTVLILIIYALLPESFRFSRALILLGTYWAVIGLVASRLFFNLFKIKELSLYTLSKKRIVIAGGQQDGNRVLSLLKLANSKVSFVGFINPGKQQDDSSKNHLGHLDQLAEIIDVYKIDEVIFCAKDIPAQQIIDHMSGISSKEIEYKIAPPESLYIIGSNSVDDTGDMYIIDLNTISKSMNRRNKRIVDLLVCFTILVGLPFIAFFIKNIPGLLRNWLLVLYGEKSWVGYIPGSADPTNENQERVKLPGIKKGILNPADAFKNRALTGHDKVKLNMLYAKDYKIYNDLNIIFKGFKYLGRT